MNIGDDLFNLFLRKNIDLPDGVEIHIKNNHSYLVFDNTIWVEIKDIGVYKNGRYANYFE